MPRETCRGTRDDGEPCGSPVVGADGFCPAHGEDGPERMREIGRKGAEAKARKDRREGLSEEELPPLDGPRAAARWMEVVGRAVTTGRLGHHEAKAAVRAVREFLRAHDAGEIAKRMEVLEEKIARLKAGDLEVVK